MHNYINICVKVLRRMGRASFCDSQELEEKPIILRGIDGIRYALLRVTAPLKNRCYVRPIYRNVKLIHHMYLLPAVMNADFSRLIFLGLR